METIIIIATVTSLSVPNLSVGSVYNITVYSQDSANRNGGISEILVVYNLERYVVTYL